MKNILKPVLSNILKNSLSPLSSFNPLSLNPLFYFDGENKDSLPETSLIENIFDLSENNNDLTQTIENSKLTLTTSSGFRVASCDGVDDFISRSDSLGLTGSPALSMFFVLNSNLKAGQATVMKIGGNVSGSFSVAKRSSSNSHELLTAFQNGSKIWNYNFTTNNIVLTITRPANSNHNATKVYVNGSEISAVTNDPSGLAFIDTMFIIGSQDFVGTNSWGGEYFSLAIYNELLSDADRQAVENFFINKYGI